MNFVDENGELLHQADWVKTKASGDSEDLRRRHRGRLQLESTPKSWLQHPELQPKEAT